MLRTIAAKREGPIPVIAVPCQNLIAGTKPENVYKSE